MWQRLFGATLATAAVVVLLVLVVRQQGLERSSYIACIVAAVAALVPVVTSLRLVDTNKESTNSQRDDTGDLANAIGRQWDHYLSDRSLHKPRLIRLRFKYLPQDGYDIPNAATAGVNGGLTKDPDAPSGDIGDIFNRLSEPRLVILGVPGAGKTVMATRLTIKLLEGRQEKSAVPVLLPISSWNPRKADLNDWIARRIAEDYYEGSTLIPRDLIDRNLILPVLDGLDDIPEDLRKEALEGIDRATSASRPLVLTCRAEEYSTIIQKSGTTLANATLVELEPVLSSDAIAYLRDSTPTRPRHWDAVAQYLTDYPQSPLAIVLSTPLMVFLARTMYGSISDNPSDLLNDSRYPSCQTIQSNLLSHYIKNSYPTFPVREEEQRKKPRWDGKDAETWLEALAVRLARENKYELSWQQLSLVSSAILPIFVCGLLLCAFLLTGWHISAEHFAKHSSLPELTLLAGSFVGLAVSVVPIGMILMMATNDMAPLDRRLAIWHAVLAASIVVITARVGWFRLDISLLVVLRDCAIGFCCGYVVWISLAHVGVKEWRVSIVGGSLSLVGCGGMLVIFVFAAGWYISFSHRLAWIYTQFSFGSFAMQEVLKIIISIVIFIAFVIAVALVAGIVSALDNLDRAKNALHNRAQAVDPDSELKMARTAALISSMLVTSLSILGTVAIFGARYSWPTVVLAAFACGLGSVGSSKWGRFVATRVWLCLCGKSPLRFMTFLRDAAERGVLRQVGASYQFRHAMLQDYLSTRR